MIKYRLIILAILFFASQFIIAQETKLDSLKNKVNIAEISGDSLEISRANFKLGKYYSYNNIDSSNIYLNRALHFAKAIKYNKAIGIIINTLAANYSDVGDHEKALALYEEILGYFEQENLLTIKAAVLMNIGMELSTIGKYSEAITKEIEALDLLIEVGDSNNIANYYCEIGILFQKVGNQNKYVEYLEKAFELIDNEYYADFYTRNNVQNEYAFLLQSNHEYEKAFAIYEKMYTDCKDNDYSNGVAVALRNMAFIRKKNGELSEAKILILESLDHNKKSQKLSNIIYSYTYLGEICYLMNSYEEAEKYLLKALNLAEEKQFSEEFKITHKMLYEMYRKKGLYKKAFEHQSKYAALKDSLENLAVKKQFAEMETKFETEQKEKKIELLNKENTIKNAQLKTQLYLFGGITFIGVLSGLYVLGLIRNKKVKAELSALQYKQSMLRSQLNPHFIFNSLNTIQNYILKNKSFESADYLSDFSRLMRLTLESSREDFIPLENEITLITDYMKLQQLRFPNLFKYNIKIDDNIDTESIAIPGMLMQPFIENSIEHAFKDNDENSGKISINIFMEQKKLIIYLSDNGSGIEDKKMNTGRKSYSMQITKERIENIYNIHKKKIDFSVETLIGEGTKIKFVIDQSDIG